MFGWLRNRVAKDDYSEIKEHMLGQTPSLYNESFSSAETAPPEPKTIDPELEPMLSLKGPLTDEQYSEGIRTPPPAFRDFANKNAPLPKPSIKTMAETPPPFRQQISPESYLEDEPPSLSSEQFNIQPRQGRSVMDRLEDDLIAIREQLAAIKAQNDIISERLKSIERGLGGERY